jgi:predicted signal transduction protein with EAL and GGDEF domain
MDPDVMFQRADTALYYMKENGRNGCCFYTDDLETLASRHKTAISKND